jgi:peptide/nickel transport system ATP-binding protein
VASNFLKLLMRLQAETGVSYVFITHDIGIVRAIADSVAVMLRGRLQRFGPKSKVLSPPFDDYTDLLLKSVPEMEIGWLEKALASRRTTGPGQERQQELAGGESRGANATVEKSAAV